MRVDNRNNVIVSMSHLIVSNMEILKDLKTCEISSFQIVFLIVDRMS